MIRHGEIYLADFDEMEPLDDERWRGLVKALGNDGLGLRAGMIPAIARSASARSTSS